MRVFCSPPPATKKHLMSEYRHQRQHKSKVIVGSLGDPITLYCPDTHYPVCSDDLSFCVCAVKAGIVDPIVWGCFLYGTMPWHASHGIASCPTLAAAGVSACVLITMAPISVPSATPSQHPSGQPSGVPTQEVTTNPPTDSAVTTSRPTVSDPSDPTTSHAPTATSGASGPSPPTGPLPSAAPSRLPSIEKPLPVGGKGAS